MATETTRELMRATASGGNVAEMLRAVRPGKPKDTHTTPDIQVWRQWCTDCRAIGESFGFFGAQLDEWEKLCGARDA